MLVMTLIIVAVLLLGFVLMSTEHINHINRAAVAIFCGVIVWILYIINGGDFLRLVHGEEYREFLQGEPSTFATVRDFIGNNVIIRYITEACAVILFLIATNTIIEVLNNNGVFDSLVKWMRMRSSKRFLWIISLITFVISANVDNLTTVVLMMSIMGQIVKSHYQRTIYACAILIAANIGGSFTVIGDMTSLMLWIRGNVTASAFSAGLFLPAFTTLCVLNLLISTLLVGKVEVSSVLNMYRGNDSVLSRWEKIFLLIVGLAGLWAIPTFKHMTGLPPFLGAFCVLALIWIIEGILNFKRNGSIFFIQREFLSDSEFISIRIILYFIGISLGIGVLKECGALNYLSDILNSHIHNTYIYGIITGLFSSVVDNVPCVMTGMNLFNISPDVSSDFAINGIYWQLLPFCSAIGGSLFLIGSLSGHTIMQVEKVRFSWFCRHMTWRIVVAWGCGLFVFWLTH